MRGLLAQTRAGFESILFSVADNLDDFDATLARERGRQERLGHPPLSLHGPFLDLNPMAFDSYVRKATMTRFNQAYEAAVALVLDSRRFSQLHDSERLLPSGLGRAYGRVLARVLRGEGGRSSLHGKRARPGSRATCGGGPRSGPSRFWRVPRCRACALLF